MNLDICDHANCGNLVYTTVPFEIVFNSKIETLLKFNPELKKMCGAYHGYACHSEGLKAGINDPCNCSRCVKQKITMNESKTKRDSINKKYDEILNKWDQVYDQQSKIRDYSLNQEHISEIYFKIKFNPIDKALEILKEKSRKYELTIYSHFYDEAIKDIQEALS